MLDQLLHHATGVVGLSDRAGFVASSDGSRPLQSGQDLAKPQGLVSQLWAAHLHRRPTQIWMALDTIRAYLVAPDAAEMVVYAMHRLRHGRVRPRPTCNSVVSLERRRGSAQPVDGDRAN